MDIINPKHTSLSAHSTEYISHFVTELYAFIMIIGLVAPTQSLFGYISILFIIKTDFSISETQCISKEWWWKSLLLLIKAKVENQSFYMS